MTTKAWWQSKTIWANIIVATLAIAGEYSKIFPISENPKVWVTIFATLNIVLRLITGQPIGTSSK